MQYQSEANYRMQQEEATRKPQFAKQTLDIPSSYGDLHARIWTHRGARSLTVRRTTPTP
jgi:hypothetical protein